MEEGGNGMNVSHESRRENFGPQDVESAARSEMSSGSWRLSVHEFPALPERRDREHGFFTLRTLLHAPRKRSKVADYYKKQERLLEVFTEMETMAENGYMPGNLTEAEMQQLSRSLAVIASTLDSLLDLLSGFILWFTAHAMRNPNLYSYPIGKNRMQPVGIIVFASVMATLGLQILLESVRQLIAQTQPEKDPEKEKWMIGIMIALYTINIWTKIVIENVWALIGRTAPPEFLAKLIYLIWNHHEDIKHIDTVRAYTFGSNYFVEVDIVLPQDMLLNKAHNIGESLLVKLEQLPEIERAFVHIDFEYTHMPEHKIAIL
nr:metal tolerance protein 6 [Quercus suber]